LHYYHHPFLAIFFNEIHACIENPRLFKVLTEGKHLDDLGRKGGCTKMILLEALPVPVLSFNHFYLFGLTVFKVYNNHKNLIASEQINRMIKKIISDKNLTLKDTTVEKYKLDDIFYFLDEALYHYRIYKNHVNERTSYYIVYVVNRIIKHYKIDYLEEIADNVMNNTYELPNLYNN